MNYHPFSQDLYENAPQDIQLPQEQDHPQLAAQGQDSQGQHVNFNFNTSQVQTHTSPIHAHIHSPTGSASPWDASALIEPPIDESEQLLQMTLMLQHQHQQVQQQFQTQAHSQMGAVITPGAAATGFMSNSPMQPPIATLSPDLPSSVYAPSPLSASTSAPSPAPSHYEPPPVIQIPERRQKRSRLQQQQQDKGKAVQQQSGQHQSQPSTPTGMSIPQDGPLAPALRKKPLSAGGAIQVQRTSARANPLPSSRSGGQVTLNSPDVEASQSALGKAGPSSSKAQTRVHPYQHARRAVSGPVPTVNTSVLGGDLTNSPASASVHSPAQSLPQFSPQISTPIGTPEPSSAQAPPRSNRYFLRTDVFLDTETNTITAMLEAPGVQQKDIKISFGRDSVSKDLIIKLRGQLCRMLPTGAVCDDAMMKRLKDEGKSCFLHCERKYGDFYRQLVVPEGTTQKDITMNLINGILFLRYPSERKARPQPSTVQARIETGGSEEADGQAAHTQHPGIPTPAPSSSGSAAGPSRQQSA